MKGPRYAPTSGPFGGRSPFRKVGASSPYQVSIGAGPIYQGAVLTAGVTGLIGGETVTYQWTRNGVNISGATLSSLTINIGVNVALDEAVRCVVTVNGTSYTSSARVVTAELPQAFTVGQWTLIAA